MADSIGWLKETLGCLTKKGFTEPNIAVGKSGDFASVLSVACSLNHIRKQGEEVKELMKPIYDGLRAFADARGFDVEKIMLVAGGNTIKELMEMLTMDDQSILTLDEKLHEIAN